MPAALRGPVVSFPVRWAGPSDIRPIAEMLADIIHPAPGLSQVETWMKAGGQAKPSTTYIADDRDTGEMLGVMIVQTLECTRRINLLAVRESHRLRGVARELIAHVEQFHSFPLDAVVCESDVPAQLFYKAVGFRWVETLEGEFVYGPRAIRDGYRMVKGGRRD